MATWYDGLCDCLGDAAAYELLESGNSEPVLASAQLNGLTKPQIICLRAYTISRKREGLTVFQRINKHLRFRARETSAVEPLDALIFTLIAALDELPVWAGPVHRRTNLPADMLEEVRAGSFADAGFLSCTTRSDLNLFGGRDWLTLRSKTGRRIGHFSANPDEDEVIFQPNTRFRVSRLDETQDGVIVILNEV
ncbi:ADP-ribosyltransferase domain-containing protein [Rhizobium sp. SL86]|uniref:ADP-ribosyltransferase domain-containing protein n=1 Tax=Rhizobium sp. SL86 TaxID=2995148 RepID=UPI002274F933|nr:ADP-ribosyltransferase domain-containing protein [Rhizobium sp. SL86]MCY1668122.1 ADP-ribosyltransferase domain-containing protein [Rhizobium sp. SL86]